MLKNYYKINKYSKYKLKKRQNLNLGSDIVMKTLDQRSLAECSEDRISR